MIRRRRTRCPALGAALAAVLALSACSGNATGSAPSAPASSGSANAPASPASSAGRGTTAPGDNGAEHTSAAASAWPGSSATDVTIAATGDILVHYSVQEDARTDARRAGEGADAYDFRPMFRHVRPLISAADVGICHQESPISTDDTNLTVPHVLNFNAPRQIAKGLKWAGIDGCDTAGNHVWDRGLTGMRETVTALRSAGLRQVGSSKTASHAGRAAYYRTPGGVTIAQLAYTYTLLNNGSPNTDVPADAPWMRHYLWPARGAEGIEQDARAARRHGADLVVVSMHWGLEYHQQPTTDQRELARALLTSGRVDLIVGSHVHVVQPCEKINGRYVMYGMGNFLSNQAPSQANGLTPSNQDGVLVLATFERRPDGTWRTGLEYQPTYVQTKGHVIRLATPAHHGASYRRTVSAVNALGDGACDARPRS
ncbi:MAG TPA: CapA family protein [Segeticoccus sp.]|uniref:CapA family protein n=1 Tax=Segeticoccus sp. TaxID=2706531 RepID=UPI002D7E2F9D|nr:CapA family protein [Segeticoccus sp.]HET8599290.1 CapA family protein [Segeticoccus sp.]